jgi:hypothetical protein
MPVEISKEFENRLQDEAQRLGLSVDDLLKKLMGSRSGPVSVGPPVPSLPVWRLGSFGPFHRRDLYHDAD